MRRTALLVVVAMFGVAEVQASIATYYSEAHRALYDFDTSTGFSTYRTVVENFESRDALFSLDTRPSDQRVFGAVTGNASNGLHTVDPNTGAHTLVGHFDSQNFLSNIAFHPISEVLYGLVYRAPSATRHLIEIDPTNGSFEDIGELPFSGGGSMILQFDENGNLFTMFRPNTLPDTTLYSVNAMDASVVAIGTNNVMNTIEDAVFLDGNLFVTDYYQKMFEVDILTGDATEVGTLATGQIGGVFTGGTSHDDVWEGGPPDFIVDISGDGLVNAIDAGTMFANWGTTNGGPSAGDIDGDESVNAIDAGLLFAGWTGDPGPSPTGIVAPEPTTCGLTMIATLCLAVGRRRRRC